ncbi:hypothetical protein VIGAN_03133300, partial [Vigna angularis var. angularis]
LIKTSLKESPIMLVKPRRAISTSVHSPHLIINNLNRNSSYINISKPNLRIDVGPVFNNTSVFHSPNLKKRQVLEI